MRYAVQGRSLVIWRALPVDEYNAESKVGDEVRCGALGCSTNDTVQSKESGSSMTLSPVVCMLWCRSLTAAMHM